jgi:hypothetical protein
MLNFFLARYTRSRIHFNRYKDLFISTTTTLLIILSACGMFNTCACWSGIYNRSREDAFVALSNEKLFAPLLRKQFPAIFVTCLGMQVLGFEIVRWVSWEGVQVLRWRED